MKPNNVNSKHFYTKTLSYEESFKFPPCTKKVRPYSHSVKLIFASWFPNFSGLTLVPN